MISAEDLILQWGVADTEAVERRQSEVTSSWMRDELERQYESKKTIRYTLTCRDISLTAVKDATLCKRGVH